MKQAYTTADSNKTLAIITAALISPIVNTTIFVVGMMIFFKDALTAWAGGTELIYYIVFGMTGVNFLVEVGVNIILCPVVSTIMDAVKKSK